MLINIWWLYDGSLARGVMFDPQDADGREARRYYETVTEASLGRLIQAIAKLDEVPNEVWTGPREDKTPFYTYKSKDAEVTLQKKEAILDTWFEVPTRADRK